MLFDAAKVQQKIDILNSDFLLFGNQNKSCTFAA